MVVMVSFIIIGIGIDVLLIGLVSSAVSNIDASAKKRIEKLSTIDAYMRYKRVPHRIRERTNEYFQYLFSCMQVCLRANRPYALICSILLE